MMGCGKVELATKTHDESIEDVEDKYRDQRPAVDGGSTTERERSWRPISRAVKTGTRNFQVPAAISYMDGSITRSRRGKMIFNFFRCEEKGVQATATWIRSTATLYIQAVYSLRVCRLGCALCNMVPCLFQNMYPSIHGLPAGFSSFKKAVRACYVNADGRSALSAK